MTGDRESRLYSNLIYLADTLVSGFDVIDLADHLVSACQELLGVSIAGILIDDQRGGLRILASSSEGMRLLELLELETNEGPCLDAFHTGERVSADALDRGLNRWPRFAPAAIAEGFVSAYAIPMRLRDRTIGALNIFHEGPAPLSENDLQMAELLAGMATIGILNHQTIRRQELLAEQLQTALNSRVVIEQAKGVISEHAGVDMEVAFGLLRDAARGARRNLSDMAADFASGKLAAESIMRVAPVSGPEATDS